MPRVMIVVGHPQTNTLCEALAKAYKIGAEAAGHQVTLFTLSGMSLILFSIMAIAENNPSSQICVPLTTPWRLAIIWFLFFRSGAATCRHC